MTVRIIRSALVAAVIVLGTGAPLAAEPPDHAVHDHAKKDGAVQKKAPAKAAKVKLVDINSASKTELTTLPNIDDAKADRIIAGRPYLSKAHLVTRKIIPHGEYEIMKRQIVALQKPDAAAKGGKK